MAQTKISIFSVDEIERYGKLHGFEYEPDENLCNVRKINYHWGSMDIINGESKTNYKQYTPNYTEEEVKSDISRAVGLKYINNIFFLDLKSDPDLYKWYISMKSAHLDQWVLVAGHTPF